MSQKKPTKKPKKGKKPKRRNPYALAALSKKQAGPHKDKRKGKGGAKNKQSLYLSDKY